MMPDAPMVRVVSFGYGHADAPDAHITLDLRTHFRDPHVSPGMRSLTADDPAVAGHVLATPGVRAAITGAVTAVVGLASGPAAAPITVAVGCTGGRHRAPTAAMTIAVMLTALGMDVKLAQREVLP